jgi:cytochrome c553
VQRFFPFVCLLAFAAEGRAASPDEQFEKVVRPLLVVKCVGCHGETKQKGDLRLDSLAAMLKGGESGPAVAPGKPEQSLIVTAVRHSEQLKMPPKEKLPAADVAALTEWVKAGAVWPDAKPVTPIPAKPAAGRTFTEEEKRFWAFQPVRRPKAPDVPGLKGPNPVDAFLAEVRTAKGLSPAPAADKRTLIRRLTFDLTGLPPTAAEVEAFEADASPDAWDKLVDRLLASPAYGEKWGRRWLDVARYADSNGMDENLAHGNAWRYRDYVIRSFNADKPYDRFVQEQIAGDLLPSGTPQERADRLTATGFLVIGPKMLAEDDPVKMRMDIIDEQLDTLGQAFLGLTLGCARCHDHKFDPLTQADYYALAGMFYSTKSMRSYGVVAQWHERPVGSAEVTAKLAEYDKNRAAASDAVKVAEGRLRDAMTARLDAERKRAGVYAEAGLQLARRRDPLRLVVADPSKGEVKGGVLVEAENYTRGNALKLTDGYGAGIGVIINGGQLPNVAEYDVEVPADGAYQIALRYAAQVARPTVLSVAGKAVRSDAAGEVTGSWDPDGQKWFAEAVVSLTKGKTTVRLERAGPFPHFDKLALLPLSKEQAAAVGPTAEEAAKEQQLLLPLVRAWAKAAEKWKGKLPAADDLAKLAADANGPFRRTPDVDAAVDAALVANVKKAKDELAAVERAKPAVDEAMAVEDDAKPQNIRVHLRGNHLTLGAEAPRRFPVILAGEKQPPITSGSGRLELADWVASKDNPLTARVMANRVWLGHFGAGLVRTPDNFGRLGERPTHPELLDYLASEFVASGWSVKHLHRLIVKSAAYRMGAEYDAEKFRTDPENRTYWRFNRRRLDAEELRDGMLAVADVLDRTAGGTLLPAKNRAYVNTTGGRGAVDFTSPRRSIYLPVIRSGLFDAFQANDFPDPSTPAGMRTQTTIPAQALFHLNSAVADQSSEAFAKSLLGLPGDDAARVREAFRRVYTRPPTAAETYRVLKFLAASDAAADAKKLKAWQSLCRVLLSSAEFVFVE